MKLNKKIMEITKGLKGYNRVYENLSKEKYWLVWVDEGNSIWGFEYNSYSEVPDQDYDKLKELLNNMGLVYVYDLPVN